MNDDWQAYDEQVGAVRPYGGRTLIEQDAQTLPMRVHVRATCLRGWHDLEATVTVNGGRLAVFGTACPLNTWHDMARRRGPRDMLPGVCPTHGRSMLAPRHVKEEM